MKKRMLTNLFLLVLLGLLWGSGYVIANYCVRHGVHPLGYGFWQSLGPAAALLCISLLRQKPRLMLQKKYLLYYFICGLLGIALPNTLIYFTSQHLPAGIIGVMANVVPLIVYPLAVATRQEKFSWLRMLAVLIGVIGIMLIILPHTQISSTVGIPWVLIILLTPLSFACCSIFIAQSSPIPSDALSLSTGMLITSSVILIPIVLGTHAFYLFHLPFQATDWLITLEIALSTLGYVIFFLLIRRAGAVYYSLVSGAVALTSVFWGWVIFHQTISIITGLGILLIIAAIGTLSTK